MGWQREGITERTERSEPTESGFSALRVSVGQWSSSPSALREASQMADNNRNWLDSIKKLPGWIKGFIACVYLRQQAEEQLKALGAK